MKRSSTVYAFALFDAVLLVVLFDGLLLRLAGRLAALPSLPERLRPAGFPLLLLRESDLPARGLPFPLRLPWR